MDGIYFHGFIRLPPHRVVGEKILVELSEAFGRCLRGAAISNGTLNHSGKFQNVGCDVVHTVVLPEDELFPDQRIPETFEEFVLPGLGGKKPA